LNLRSGSRVKNVNLVRSGLTRDSGATVTGTIHHRESIAWRGAWAVFSVLLWVGITVAVVIAGLIFAAVGGRQLRTAAVALTEQTVNTIVGAVFLWIGAPVVAVLLFFTVIGIPMGIGLFLFVLPTLWLLGYIVAATRLGGAITKLASAAPDSHPYAATFVGLIILQIVVLIPGIGWLVGGLAGVWGAGAIAFLAFRAARGGPPAVAAPPPGPAAQPEVGAPSGSA
jgi:hypothetical protein